MLFDFRARSFTPAAALAESAVLSLAAAIKCGRPPSPRHLDAVLVACRLAGRHRLLAHLFSHLTPSLLAAPTPYSRALATRALLRCGCLRDAEAMLRADADGIPARCRNGLWDSLIIRLCIYDGNPSHAFELALDCVRARTALLSMETYRTLLSALCCRGDMESAVKLFNEMPSSLADNDVVVMIVSGFTRIGKPELGLKFFERMKDLEGFVPNMETTTAVIDAAACKERSGVKHSGAMSQSLIDNYLCSMIVSGLTSIGKTELGLELYEKVKKVDGFAPNLVSSTSVVGVEGSERTSDASHMSRGIDNNESVESSDTIYSGDSLPNSEGLIKMGHMLRLNAGKGVCPTVVDCETSISELCKEGSVEKVVEFLEMMERKMVKLNLYHCSSLVSSFCKCGRVDDALIILRRLEESDSVDEFVYTIMIDSFCKKGDLEQAFFMLEHMEKKGINATTVTYNAVINGLCKIGDMDKAMEIFEALKADNFTYSTVLHGFMKKNDKTNLLATIQRLEEAKIPFDVVTCNVLIKVMFMIGKCDDAWDLYRKMPEMGLTASSHTYCTMVDGCCKHSMFEKAMEIFEEYKNASSFACDATHSCYIKGLCRDGMIDTAIQVFEDLVSRNISPRLSTFRKLISVSFRNGGGDAVLNLIRRLDYIDTEVFSMICNDAVSFLSRNENVSIALEAYMLLRQKVFTISAKTSYILLKGLLRHGSKEVAQPLLTESIKFHGLYEPRMANLLSRFLSLYNIEDALHFSNVICNQNVPISVLRNAVYALKRQGEIQDAYNFFVEAKENGQPVDLAIYAILVDGLCRGGFLEKALDLCSEMGQEGIFPNVIIHNSVLNGLCHHGCFTEAFRLIEYLESQDVISTAITYAILINSLCREGYLDDANNLFERMSARGIHPNVRIYNSMISGYCNFGLVEKAMGLIANMEQQHLLADSFTVGTLIYGYCLVGDIEGAFGFYNEWSKIRVPDFVGFVSLVKGFYTKGRMEEARNILNDMFQCTEVVDLINSAGEGIHVQSLVSLLSHASEQGRLKEVLSVLNEVGFMSQNSLEYNSFNMIAQLNELQKTKGQDQHSQISDPEPHVDETMHFETSNIFSSCDSDEEMKHEGALMCPSQTQADIIYEQLLQKSFFDGFDSYYPLLSTLCSNGNLTEANNAVRAMLSNSASLVPPTYQLQN